MCLLDPLEELACLPRDVALMPRRIELCRQALTRVQRQEEPELWAKLQWELGMCLADTVEGNRVHNLEQALKHYQAALEVYAHCEAPFSATRVTVSGVDLIQPIHDATDIYDMLGLVGFSPGPMLGSDSPARSQK